MRTYHVRYRLRKYGDARGIDVAASNIQDAYSRAVYEQIPDVEGEIPYSAWVVSVTYQNGGYREFDTYEGEPF